MGGENLGPCTLHHFYITWVAGRPRCSSSASPEFLTILCFHLSRELPRIGWCCCCHPCHLQTHGEVFLFPLEVGCDSAWPIHVVRLRLLLLLILSFVVLVVWVLLCGYFFTAKCIVNKWTSGFFGLIHVEWQEQLLLVLCQAEKKVLNPFLCSFILNTIS